MTTTQFLTDHEAIHQWLYAFCYLGGYSIMEDGSVDVTGDIAVVLPDEISVLPVKFGRVTGEFHITNAKALQSLRGCPTHVVGEFDCSGCVSLLTLEGAPESVGSFEADGCTALRSTYGIPPNIGSFVNLANNPNLTDLASLPLDLEYLYLGGCSALQFTETHVKHAAGFDFKIADVQNFTPLTIRELLLAHKSITFLNFSEVLPPPAWLDILEKYNQTNDLLTAIAEFEDHFKVPFQVVTPTTSLPGLSL